MNNSEPEYEASPAGPLGRQDIEHEIALQLTILKEQVSTVNDKLQINMRILSEKQSENRHLKEMLAKFEASLGYTGHTQATETNLSHESNCVSCKSCVVF